MTPKTKGNRKKLRDLPPREGAKRHTGQAGGGGTIATKASFNIRGRRDHQTKENNYHLEVVKSMRLGREESTEICKPSLTMVPAECQKQKDASVSEDKPFLRAI